MFVVRTFVCSVCCIYVFRLLTCIPRRFMPDQRLSRWHLWGTGVLCVCSVCCRYVFIHTTLYVCFHTYICWMCVCSVCCVYMHCLCSCVYVLHLLCLCVPLYICCVYVFRLFRFTSKVTNFRSLARCLFCLLYICVPCVVCICIAFGAYTQHIYTQHTEHICTTNRTQYIYTQHTELQGLNTTHRTQHCICIAYEYNEYNTQNQYVLPVSFLCVVFSPCRSVCCVYMYCVLFVVHMCSVCCVYMHCV